VWLCGSGWRRGDGTGLRKTGTDAPAPYQKGRNVILIPGGNGGQGKDVEYLPQTSMIQLQAQGHGLDSG